MNNLYVSESISIFEKYLNTFLLIKGLIISIFVFIPPKKISNVIPFFSIPFGITIGLTYCFLLLDFSIYNIEESMLIIIIFIIIFVCFSLNSPVFNRIQIFTLFYITICMNCILLMEEFINIYALLCIIVIWFLFFIYNLILKARFNFRFLNIQLVVLGTLELSKILSNKWRINIPKYYYNVGDIVLTKLFNCNKYRYYLKEDEIFITITIFIFAVLFFYRNFMTYKISRNGIINDFLDYKPITLIKKLTKKNFWNKIKYI